MSELTVDQIDDYRINWLKTGNEETSFQIQINSFKAMLSWGVKHGHIGRNPLDQYEIPKKARAEEKQALDEDEIRRSIIALKNLER